MNDDTFYRQLTPSISGLIYIVTLSINGNLVNKFSIGSETELKEKVTDTDNFMKDVSHRSC